jgi:hypothetical protein
MPPFTFDPNLGRYRNDQGRLVSEARIRELAHRAQEVAGNDLQAIAGRFHAGEINRTTFEAEFRATLRATSLAEYALGRGGFAQMSAADYGRVGRYLRDQYAYARGFADAITGGELSLAQVEARAALYGNATTAMLERGRAAARGLDLPAYPAIGTTCRANCLCSWSIRRVRGGWRCKWVRSAEDSCDTCLSRERQYRDLFVQSG